MKESEIKIGTKVKLEECRTRSSCNQTGDIGLITEIDKVNFAVRVTVSGRKNVANWENAKFLTKL